MSRRSFIKTSALAAGGATLLGTSACGGDDESGAGEFELVVAHQLATATPFHEGLTKFAELVKEKTDGRVTSTIHPNAELGIEVELFGGLQEGTIDVSVTAPYSVEESFQGPSVLTLPFLVTSHEQRDAIIESDAAKKIADAILEETGVHVGGYFGGGVRHALLRAQASSIADIGGRLFRSPPGGKVMADAWNAVGVNPTVIPYNELYNALQQGVVDGYESDPAFIISDNMFEVAPHLLLTSHEVTIRYITISSHTLDRLPSDMGDAVMEAAMEASEFERGIEQTANDDGLRALEEEHGMEIVEPPDIDAAIPAVEPVWHDYAGRTGVEEALQAFQDMAV